MNSPPRAIVGVWTDDVEILDTRRLQGGASDNGKLIMETYSATEEDVERAWWHIDLEGEILGRAASQIATLLRGKHKPIFTRHVDCGDFVVVTNCEKVELTGNKLDQKMYRRHTGYPGGLDEISAEELLERKPEKIIEFAVKGMLPKNKLGDRMLKKLKVYPGPDHPHEAQSPETFELDS